MRARGFAAGGRGRPGHQLPVAVQDDALLLNRSPAQVQQYTGQIAQEGAGYVRLTASWSGLAPTPQSTRHPGAPFAASDSSTYPPDSFRRLDTAVNAAAAAGLVNRQGGLFTADGQPNPAAQAFRLAVLDRGQGSRRPPRSGRRGGLRLRPRRSRPGDSRWARALPDPDLPRHSGVDRAAVAEAARAVELQRVRAGPLRRRVNGAEGHVVGRAALPRPLHGRALADRERLRREEVVLDRDAAGGALGGDDRERRDGKGGDGYDDEQLSHSALLRGRGVGRDTRATRSRFDAT